MSKCHVADIELGKPDPMGSIVAVMYGKVNGVYAVYGTAQRIVIQYADDPDQSDPAKHSLGSEQRLAVRPLNPVRGEINGLIDGWRDSVQHGERAKAQMFDRRVADALIVALQGDQVGAAALLDAIKADILAVRQSVARRQYILYAVYAVAAVALVTAFLSSPLSWIDCVFRPLWSAAGFGAMGAFFSIALGIRNRSVCTDLHKWNNIVDAVLRILIGAISAMVLYCLIDGKLVRISLGDATFPPVPMPCPAPVGPCTSTHGLCPPAPGWCAAKDIAIYVDIVLAFIAGFSERLVGDLLSRAGIAGAQSGSTSTPTGGTPAPSTPGSTPNTPNELNPRGLAAAPQVAASATGSSVPATQGPAAQGPAAQGNAAPAVVPAAVVAPVDAAAPVTAVPAATPTPPQAPV